MFSDAISSTSWRCRPSSPRIAAAISGSASVRVAVKNESGAEAVLALEDEGLMSEISPPPQPVKRGAGGHVWRSIAAARGIPYRAAAAKRLRYKPDIYARYGGGGRVPARLVSRTRCSAKRCSAEAGTRDRSKT